MNVIRYYKKELPIWKTKNNFMFTQEFRKIVLFMLCIQKYHFKYIDKNIFFLILQKIVSIEHLLPIKKITVENLIQMRFLKNCDTYIDRNVLENKFIKSYFYYYKYSDGYSSGYEGKGKDYFKLKKYIDILKNEEEVGIIIGKNTISFSFKDWDEKITISLALNFNLYTNVRKRKMFFNRIFRKKIEPL
jgi:hypothetical protein